VIPCVPLALVPHSFTHSQQTVYSRLLEVLTARGAYCLHIRGSPRRVTTLKIKAANSYETFYNAAYHRRLNLLRIVYLRISLGLGINVMFSWRKGPQFQILPWYDSPINVLRLKGWRLFETRD
jgi:hypothetical protein